MILNQNKLAVLLRAIVGYEPAIWQVGKRPPLDAFILPECFMVHKIIGLTDRERCMFNYMKPDDVFSVDREKPYPNFFRTPLEKFLEQCPIFTRKDLTEIPMEVIGEALDALPPHLTPGHYPSEEWWQIIKWYQEEKEKASS